MSRDQAQNLEPLKDEAQLLEYFRSGEKDPSKPLGFGTEHEKLVFDRQTLKMLTFDEPGGFADIFAQLEKEYGWEASLDRGKIVALVKDGAAITLEPGGQLELSGAIKQTAFETAQEFDDHIRELKQLTGERLAYMCLGMNPFYGPEDIPWMPKARYEIMRNYMPKRGDRGIWMMKTTCTVQGNYDYVSEEDAADILRTGLRISPIVSAMMANSPITQGKPNGMQTYRCHIWTRTDPDRTGFPDFMYHDGWGYAEYLNYVLDVPMYFIRREGRYVDLTGTSFRSFMQNGHEGWYATMGDFELHLSTIFPEVRMKTYIEVRGADAGSRDMMIALPTLWKGIFYDQQARKEANSLIISTTPAQHRECFNAVIQDGLHANTPCGSYLDMAKQLVQIASDGLDRIAQRDGHATESVFLDPITQHLNLGQSPADEVLAVYQKHQGDMRAIIEHFEF